MPLPPRRWILTSLLAVFIVLSTAVATRHEVLADPASTVGRDAEVGPDETPETGHSDPQEWLAEKLENSHWAVLLLIMAFSIAALGKGADWLVEEAVEVSVRLGMPHVVIGATVVSLGTTTPEAVVSVLAAMQGNPGIALGNSVGSIICDTGLILGLACLMAPLPINRAVVNRQAWVQFGCGLLLVSACIPWSDPLSVFTSGSTLSQLWGFIFLGLLAAYMVWSIQLARGVPVAPEEQIQTKTHSTLFLLVRLFTAVAIVVVASWFLVGSAKVLAERWGVPEGIIAATLIAFGTSLPELIIAVTAVRKGHGELAIGNVVGADILNVLFVAGAAAAVTPAGLAADVSFFQIQFPAMLFILIVFRIGIWTARDDKLSRTLGVVLLGTYVLVTVASYLVSVR